jgi:HKD family nuclease
MKLFLHSPSKKSELTDIYKNAFLNAKELFVVSAYLTDWDKTLILNSKCKHFRLIIGKDFGITRKAACEKVIKWLSSSRKSQFMVADNILGFHPKAMLWIDSKDKCFSLIGSSNLTRAAFEKNYEANIYSEISTDDYATAKKWVKEIETKSVIVSEDWLKNYVESVQCSTGKASTIISKLTSPTISLKLPTPPDIDELLKTRRKQLRTYKKNKDALLELFRSCANEEIESSEFYEQLPLVWSWEVGNRLQGEGFERLGKASDFQALAKSFLRILESSDADRDDVVVEEIDDLSENRVPTRKAFLSEMLCLAFPNDYPVLNNPVKNYLKAIKFSAPRGATEGGKYLDLAKKLRSSLIQNPKHPAKNIAELDTVIWRVYGEQAKSNKRVGVT